MDLLRFTVRNDMYEPDHLTKAREYSNLPESRFFYFKHMYWALHASVMFLSWAVLMFVHALIPSLVGFHVIHKLVEYVKHLKEIHPDDPLLKDIVIDDANRKTD